MWTTSAYLIDTHTWATTRFTSTLPNGEYARFGVVLDDRYYFEANGSPIHSFDLTDPTLPPTNHGPYGPWYGSAAADRANHTIYVANLDGQSLWLFDPAGPSLIPLTGRTGYLWHSSLAFTGTGVPRPRWKVYLPLIIRDCEGESCPIGGPISRLRKVIEAQ